MSKINEIEDLTGLDAFSELDWKAEKARDMNLVYGWNGSGKTTLSRVLSFFEHGEIRLEEFDGVDIKINTNEGKVKTKDFEDNNLNIRVFNDHYIENNISFDRSTAEPIIIIGEDRIEQRGKIESLETEIEELNNNIKEKNNKLNDIKNTDKILTRCGRAVINNFRGSGFAYNWYTGRKYNRGNVRERINDEDITKDNVDNLIIKNEERINTLWQNVRMDKENIQKPNLDIDTFISDFKNVLNRANAVLTRRISAETIHRLDEDDEVREWVGRGFELHKERKEKDCFFCGNRISESRVEKLGRYFTEEVERAEKQVENGIDETTDLKQTLEKLSERLPKPSDFFQNTAESYKQKKNELSKLLRTLVDIFNDVLARLEARKNRTQLDESIQEEVSPDDNILAKLRRLIGDINDYIEKHNLNVERGDEKQKKAARKLEKHIIAKKLKSNNFFQKKYSISEIQNDITKAKRVQANKKENLKNEKEKLRDASIAVNRINKLIAEFVGEGNIELRIDIQNDSNEEDRYYLEKNGDRIRFLSDGEKSIVALSYFLVSLKDENKSIDDLIVVIDDPVDSQDKQYLFRSFGLLREYLKQTKQWFVFTHNYELFQLFKGWLTVKYMSDKSSLFWIEMISKNDNGNKVIIEDLPELIEQYTTEYQFLFYKLYCFNENNSIGSPVIPNIARKIIEKFCYFKWSCRGDTSLGSMIQEKFIKEGDEEKKAVGTGVKRFLHRYSHGGQVDRDVAASVMEADDVAKTVLDFIRVADKEHYESVLNSLPGCEAS